MREVQELGLVVNQRSGDVVIFKSSEISHFNLHYKGQSSDKMAAGWVENRNGWDHNIFMKTFDSDIKFGL